MGANQVDLAYAFGLPPERAIRYFETLGYTVPTDWPQRMQQAAAKAQTIAGIYRQDVVADIHRALGESAAKGTPFAKFRDAVERQLTAKGLHLDQAGDMVDAATGELLGKGITPQRLEVIYRTNMQNAYMAGRWQELQDNRAAMPYKYSEWSESLQGFGRWLDKYLPSFRGDSKGEWLKSRIGQSPDAAQAYQDYLRGQGHTPLDSPELRMSAEQLQEAAQRMENSGEQYAQAVSDNQQAAAQFLEASRLMGTAAGLLAAAARQPVPVTVSVSGGNITAAVSQAAERDNRRN